MLRDYQIKALIDRFEGWEVVEMLDVSTEDVVMAALRNDWINEENVHELLELARIDE